VKDLLHTNFVFSLSVASAGEDRAPGWALGFLTCDDRRGDRGDDNRDGSSGGDRNGGDGTPRRLPRTTSGQMRRRMLRRQAFSSWRVPSVASLARANTNRCEDEPSLNRTAAFARAGTSSDRLWLMSDSKSL
jgi:hypothetical protein